MNNYFETFVDKIEQNKLLISSSINKPMTAVILMLRGNRFTKSNQDFLKSLNDWTFGKIWQNLIILNGRQRFTIEDLKKRFETQTQRLTVPTRVVNLKKLDGNAIYKGKSLLSKYEIQLFKMIFSPDHNTIKNMEMHGK